MIAVQAASLISGERTHQTLDVLLTTPLSGREILRQKLRGVRRLMVVLAIPFATIFLFEAWLRTAVGNGAWGDTVSERFSSVRYLITSGLTVGVYLPMIAWLSAWIGLRARSQTRAMMGALAVILGWCVLPLLCVVPTLQLLSMPVYSNWAYLTLLSPMIIVPLNEANEFREFPGGPWSVVVLNFAIYGPCLFWFRQLALRSADRLQEGAHAR
jgi:ABC-type Na+ efflux pump permease subunit